MRAYDPDLSFEEAIKLLLVSFDSTVKANLGVGLPFDVEVYETDTYSSERHKRFDATDEIYKAISTDWGDALRDAFRKLPSYSI